MKRLQPFAWFGLFTVVLAAAAGIGMRGGDGGERPVARSDCGEKQAGRKHKPEDDWGWNVFDGFSASAAHLSVGAVSPSMRASPPS
ncbi:MAG: hypothetical protein ACLFWF_09255 [Alphaproteobacteria bacterium]